MDTYCPYWCYLSWFSKKSISDTYFQPKNTIKIYFVCSLIPFLFATKRFYSFRRLFCSLFAPVLVQLFIVLCWNGFGICNVRRKMTLFCFNHPIRMCMHEEMSDTYWLKLSNTMFEWRSTWMEWLHTIPISVPISICVTKFT